MLNKWELNFVVKKISQETNSKISLLLIFLFTHIIPSLLKGKEKKKNKPKQFFEVGAKNVPLALKDHLSLCCREVLLSCPFLVAKQDLYLQKSYSLSELPEII